MAIETLDRITLYGAARQKDDTIRRLQDLGCAHLVNLRLEECAIEMAEDAASETAEEDHSALEYLQACGQQLRASRRAQGFDREKVVSEALDIQRTERKLVDEQAELRKALADLEPWGEFRLPPADRFGKLRWWFYVVPLHQADKLALVELPYDEARRDHRNVYVVVLSGEEPEEFPGHLIQLDQRPLSEVKDRLVEVGELLEDLHHRRVGVTRWRDLLANSLAEADDAARRVCASHMTFDERGVFAISGWAPHAAAGQIERLAEENELALTIEPPGPDDDPPTLLNNPDALAGAETLVTFYTTPKYGSWDPSIVAFLSFAVFFAMIVADAGYGLAFALFLAAFWRKLGSSAAGSRGRNVIATIVGFTILYGVVCGSYFGASPAENGFLDRLRIIDVESQDLMMPLTIAIGVFHLSLANLVVAWKNRGKAIALSSLGWVAVMAGGIVAGVAMAQPEAGWSAGAARAGLGLLVGGLVAVFLFSSERPFLSPSLKNHVLRIFDGLQGLTGISGLFGDVLSYLRLFALGLSSAKLAQTFNGLAQDAWDSAGFGVIMAIAVVLIGHLMNLVLCIMSGAVHGLRLNCIEFFKWSLPDEGHSFVAFSKKAR